jgi:hypothetical protein
LKKKFLQKFEKIFVNVLRGRLELKLTDLAPPVSGSTAQNIGGERGNGHREREREGGGERCLYFFELSLMYRACLWLYHSWRWDRGRGRGREREEERGEGGRERGGRVDNFIIIELEFAKERRKGRSLLDRAHC